MLPHIVFLCASIIVPLLCEMNDQSGSLLFVFATFPPQPSVWRKRSGVRKCLKNENRTPRTPSARDSFSWNPFALWREGWGANLTLNKSDGCGEVAADLKVNKG